MTLDDLLVGLDEQLWSQPTPAAGWTVADQVRHLVTSERAASMAVAGRGAALFGGDVGIEPVRSSRPADLLVEWRGARAKTVAGFEVLDERDEVVWGAGPMSARSLAQSRLMETWAHGLDCFAGVGREPVDTARLRHVADLGRRALPYAFAVAGEEAPGDPRRVALDLTGPGGEGWWFGPEDAADRISGSASEWCRVAVRRLPVGATSLATTGELGRASLRVARAYLAD